MPTLTALLLILAYIFVPEPAFANIVPCSGPDCQLCSFVQLGNSVLAWLIGIMSFVGALVIMVAGFKMVLSQGNGGDISEARSMITNTIVGFIILLAAWLIVDTVMKLFVGDTIPKWGPWNKIECVAQPTGPAETGTVGTGQQPSSGACPVPPLSPITDPLAQRMEAGEKIIWTNDTLRQCVNKFTARVGGTVTSVYRPPAYQAHLYEIRDRWCTRGLKDNNDPACAELKASIYADASSHFRMSDWNCGAVAASNSTHSSGVGVDITGINHSSAAVQRAASESCLIWKNYPNDPVHYDLKAGCTCN